MSTEESTPTKPKSVRRFSFRSVAAGICLMLSFVLTVPAVVGFWGQRTLTDSQRYVATVGPIASDPAIRKAVSELINKNFQEKVDVKSLLQEWLPPEADPLAGPIAGAVNSFIAEQVESFINSEAFAKLWVAVNTKAQIALIKALSANPEGALQIEDDKVVLDLGELIAEVQEQLVARGLTVVEDIPIPPAADRQIVLLESEQLAQARLIYAFSIPIARWLIVVVVLLALGAILFARRRARMVVTVGVLLIVSMVLLRLGLRFGEVSLTANASDGVMAAAQTAFFNAITTYLITAIRAGYVVGILMILFGWLFGRSGSALASRNALSRSVGGAGAKAGSSDSISRVGAWVAPKRVPLIGAVVAIAGLVVVASDPLTAGTLLLLAVLVVLAVLAIQILAASAPPPTEQTPIANVTEVADEPSEAATPSA